MEPQKKSRKKFVIIPIVIIVLCIVSYYIYNSLEYNKVHEETDNAQIEGDIVPIIPRTAGYITAIHFSDNQFVHAGDTLFIIDSRELKTKLQQAEAALSNAEANVGSAESLIKTGEANLSVSKANADASKENIENAKVRLSKAIKDYDRYNNLLKTKSITQQQFDAALTDKQSNEAQLAANQKQYLASQNQAAAALAQINNYTKQVVVAKSVLEQRKQDVEYAKLQLSYTVVTAPYDGFIYKKIIQIGQYVQPGAQLFNMISSKKMWVVANFKETQTNNLKAGQKAEISIDALNGKKIYGTVQSFSKATGSRLTLLPPDNATGNFVKVVQRIPIKISIDENDSSILNKLSVGMNVVVNVSTK
ncbi:MAG: HlyD family secretion protein [Chitinophagaceae bacterium]|nr:HlyD family secretion protein [Chitinophagaceae bacterium]